MKQYLTYILLLTGFVASAQHRISGSMKDRNGMAVPAASVLLNKTPAATTDSVGQYKVPVTLPAARSYFLGVFLSFGIDRTADFLNNDL